MKSRNRLKQSLSQFSYKHKKLDSHMNKMRRSTEELTNMLEHMGCLLYTSDAADE